MLRMGKLTDYGIVLMTYFAQNQTIKHSAHTLSDNVHMPLPTVRKILKVLSHNDLLTSTRGANGGYQLSRDARDISIADIISAIEGPIAITECAGHDSQCEQAAFCHVQTDWQQINQAVYEALDDVKLSSMTAKAATSPITVYPLNQHKMVISHD